MPCEAVRSAAGVSREPSLSDVRCCTVIASAHVSLEGFGYKSSWTWHVAGSFRDTRSRGRAGFSFMCKPSSNGVQSVPPC